MRNRHIAIRILLYALFLLIVYWLQGLVFPHIPLHGLAPILLPVAAVGVALFEGSFRGGVFGLFAGMLCDISFNQPTMMFTLFLTVVGLGVGALSETFIARGFPSFFVMSAAVLLVGAFLQMFRPLFFGGAPIGQILRIAAFQTLYSLVFTLPMYYIVRMLGRGSRRT